VRYLHSLRGVNEALWALGLVFNGKVKLIQALFRVQFSGVIFIAFLDAFGVVPEPIEINS
jgi:hypothetical protein